jgi:uncharacterized membrane protein
MNEDTRHAQPNIDAVARQKQKAVDERTRPERASDGIAGFAGSMAFVPMHGVILLGWILVNTGRVVGIRPFDPYPFGLLAMIVAVEAVVLLSFILMRQNRMAKWAERRDHLTLQVDLLTEKEVTKLLHLVRAICGHLGLKDLADDKELNELSQRTSVDSLTERLENTLPKD